MNSIINALQSLQVTVNTGTQFLSQYYPNVLSVVSWSRDFLGFILQFIPQPMLWLFSVEIIVGVCHFLVSTVQKTKVVIKWW